MSGSSPRKVGTSAVASPQFTSSICMMCASTEQVCQTPLGQSHVELAACSRRTASQTQVCDIPSLQSHPSQHCLWHCLTMPTLPAQPEVQWSESPENHVRVHCHIETCKSDYCRNSSVTEEGNEYWWVWTRVSLFCLKLTTKNEESQLAKMKRAPAFQSFQSHDSWINTMIQTAWWTKRSDVWWSHFSVFSKLKNSDRFSSLKM